MVRGITADIIVVIIIIIVVGYYGCCCTVLLQEHRWPHQHLGIQLEAAQFDVAGHSF